MADIRDMTYGAPPIEFDGRFYWYTDWTDPAEDRCSLCRELIPEETVPLCLFKHVGAATWQARFCDVCAPIVVSRLRPPAVTTPRGT